MNQTLTPPPLPRPWRTWLFNPFHYIAGGQALGIGLVLIVLAGVLAAWSGSRFDGVLDFHSGAQALPLWPAAADGIINWLSMAVVLWPVGMLLSRSKVRALDVLGTQALARWPMVVTALVALLPGYRRYTEGVVRALENATLASIQANPARLLLPEGVTAFDIAQFAVTIVVMLVMTVWMVALMYRGFAVSCNLRGARAAAGFVPGLLVAEVLSKVLIMALLFVPSLAISGRPAGFSVEHETEAFVRLLKNGDFEEATERFDGTLRQRLSAEKLAEVWNGLGTYSMSSENIVVENGILFDSGYMLCRFYGGGWKAVQVVFGMSGKVAGLWIRPPDQIPGHNEGELP
jgi:hypothetical protein